MPFYVHWWEFIVFENDFSLSICAIHSIPYCHWNSMAEHQRFIVHLTMCIILLLLLFILHTQYLIWNGRDIFFTSSIFTLALLMRFFSFNAAENKIYFDKKRKLCLCLDLMSHDYKRNCKLFTCWIRRRFVMASMVNFGAV